MIFRKLEGLSTKRHAIGLLGFIFPTKLGVDRVHNSVDMSDVVEMALRLIRPRREELRSKGEM
jgi:hypothetical protein